LPSRFPAKTSKSIHPSSIKHQASNQSTIINHHHLSSSSSKLPANAIADVNVIKSVAFQVWPLLFPKSNLLFFVFIGISLSLSLQTEVPNSSLQRSNSANTVEHPTIGAATS
jgi:hypothetical protein